MSPHRGTESGSDAAQAGGALLSTVYHAALACLPRPRERRTLLALGRAHEAHYESVQRKRCVREREMPRMMTTEAPDGTTGASGRSRWLQMGLLTAGAAAPLIARWRALRAAERAEALREQAAGRWNDAMAWAAQSLPSDGIQDAIQGTIQERIPQAQESIRQVSAAARDALRRLPLPLASAAEPPAPITAAAHPATASRRANAALWALGVGVGVVAAGAIAYVVLRNRMAAARDDDDTLVEIPLTAAAAPTSAPPEPGPQAQTVPLAPEGPAITEGAPAEEPGEAEPLAYDEGEGEGAAYVGNILTRIYHPAGSQRLPTPQHRIYFATRAEADEAGYRPDASESAPHGPDATRRHD